MCVHRLEAVEVPESASPALDDEVDANTRSIGVLMLPLDDDLDSPETSSRSKQDLEASGVVCSLVYLVFCMSRMRKFWSRIDVVRWCVFAMVRWCVGALLVAGPTKGYNSVQASEHDSYPVRTWDMHEVGHAHHPRSRHASLDDAGRQHDLHAAMTVLGTVVVADEDLMAVRVWGGGVVVLEWSVWCV